MDLGVVDALLHHVCCVVYCHGCCLLPCKSQGAIIRWGGTEHPGWKWVPLDIIGLGRALGPAPTLHPSGYIGTSSVNCCVLLSWCWEQLEIRERLFFLPPPGQHSQPPRQKSHLKASPLPCLHLFLPILLPKTAISQQKALSRGSCGALPMSPSHWHSWRLRGWL